MISCGFFTQNVEGLNKTDSTLCKNALEQFLTTHTHLKLITITALRSDLISLVNSLMLVTENDG